MDYKIIIDSCGELTDKLKKDGHFVNVPLTMQVDGKEYIDDESFNQAEFLKAVSDSPNVPKSACPSPESYLKEFDCDAERIYVITLSSQLSGSYNSACLAREIYLESHENDEVKKQIAVFDSRSASIGQTLIGIFVNECEKYGRPFEDIVRRVEKYRSEMNTFFFFLNIETLRKNGRLSRIKALAANMLSIKPVLGSTEDGSICQLDQARGINKALDKMISKIIEKNQDGEKRPLAISHCNCLERAMAVKTKIEEMGKFSDIIVINTAGCSTMYANQGGIIIAV